MIAADEPRLLLLELLFPPPAVAMQAPIREAINPVRTAVGHLPRRASLAMALKSSAYFMLLSPFAVSIMGSHMFKKHT